METMVDESRITIALQSKLPKATNHFIVPEDLIRVFTEISYRWEGDFAMVRINNKMVFVTDGLKVKPFKPSATLLIAPKKNNGDIKNDMTNIKAFLTQQETTLPPVDIWKLSDLRTRFTKCEEVIRHDINDPLAR